ncbi:hypothetical protein BWI96_18940 [Siphonobacter sp. SORGH_AS_0500]|uniref:phage tail tape measure protein n=1 Tax=Siphonobacter sp. SORGH_AS_0500 TaxID=1864824 RepID=UPI000CAE0448|nr:phage tail tape measure protein [Siphonobacter sp. SORGH_AS_0500]PKK35131.1 hypothetical protein BWI96_18940 [Siphonobacter sp. SORGH_AS_0500]
MSRNVRTDEVQARLSVDAKQAINELGKLKTESQSLVVTNKALQKEYDRLNKKLATANAKGNAEKAKQLSDAMTGLTTQMKANSRSIDQNAAKYDAIIKQEGMAVQTTSQLRNYRSMLARQLDKELIPNTKEYIETLELLHKVDEQLATRKQNMKALPKPETLFSMKNITKQIPSAIAGGIGGALVGAASQMAGDLFSTIDDKIEKIGEKSDAITALAQAFGMTTREAQALDRQVGEIDNRLGAKTMREIATEAGKLDVPIDQVKGYTEAVGQATLAMQDDFPQGAAVLTEDLTKIKGLFSDTHELEYADSVYKIGSAMKVLADSGTATADFQVDFLKRMGQVPEKIRPGIRELMGMAAVLEESGMTSEIAASGMTKVLTVAGDNSKGFAKLFGMSKKAFEEWLNTKPNEFLIQFAERISNMKGTQAIQTLKNLKVESDEALKAIGALGGDIEKVKTKVDAGAAAFDKGARLTEIFAQKNDNLAGRVERAGNAISKWFNNSILGTTLEKITGGFADLILSIDKANPSIEGLTAQISDQSKTVDHLQKDISPLLSRYDQLKAKTTLTKDEQAELKRIVDQVAQAIPGARTEINRYGQAMAINTGIARNFIETQAKILKALNEDKIRAENKNILETRADFLKATKEMYHRDAKGNLLVYATSMVTGMNGARTLIRKATDEEAARITAKFAETQAAFVNAKIRMGELDGSNMLALAKGIKDPEKPIIDPLDPESLKEKKGKTEAEKLAEERVKNDLESQRKATQMQIDMIQQESDRKATQLITDHANEVTDQKKLLSEKKLSLEAFNDWKKTADFKLQQDLLDLDAQVNKQIDDRAKEAAKHAAEMVLREAKTYAETKVESAKAAVLAASDVEQKVAAEDALYMAELGVLEAERDLALVRATEEEKVLIKKDFLTKQLALENKFFEAVGKAQKEGVKRTKLTKQEELQVQEAYTQLGSQIAGAYFDISAAYREQEMNQVERDKDRKTKILEDQLARGLITQEQYNSQKESMDKEMDDKRKELQRKQAIQDKLNAIFQATLNSILAVSNANKVPPPVGPILAGIAAATGAVQVAKIAATPIPEFAGGGYTELEAKKNPSGFTPIRKGMLSITGESGREYVVNNTMLKNPHVQDMVGIMESYRTRGMASSGYTPQWVSSPAGAGAAVPVIINQKSESDALMLQVLSELRDEIKAGLGFSWQKFERQTDTMDQLKNASRVRRTY